MSRPRRIVAMGGFGADEADATRMVRHVAELTGAARPKVAYLGTAGGDAEAWRARWLATFAELGCDATSVNVFVREIDDLAGCLLQQDAVFVGGGNTANLLAVWRVHGLDVAVRRAWEAGVLLSGVSAGMNCWFEASVTDSFGIHRLDPLRDGLGLLSGSACPHYDGEPLRRPGYRSFVADGDLPGGYAVDDAAALVFTDSAPPSVIAVRSGAGAYRVSRTAGGGVEETRV